MSLIIALDFTTNLVRCGEWKMNQIPQCNSEMGGMYPLSALRCSPQMIEPVQQFYFASYTIGVTLYYIYNTSPVNLLC